MTSIKLKLLVALISIIILFSGFCNYIMIKGIESDASAINYAGIIRGSIQRIAKQELICRSSDDEIKNVDRIIESFVTRKIDVTSFFYNSRTFYSLIEELNHSWKLLKNNIYKYRVAANSKARSDVITPSEKLWELSNNTVFSAQFLSENKVNSFKFLFISIGINLVLLLVIFFIIKNYVQNKLEYHYSHDPLTHSCNRNCFTDHFAMEIHKASRYDRPLSVIMFDIDHFKKINNVFGHPIGDSVLKKLVDVVKANIRDEDCFARIGGEEFVILAPETEIDSAVSLAEKIRKVIEQHQFDRVEKVTVSLGVARFEKGLDKKSLFEKADNALYKAKNNGRNRAETAE